MLASKAEDWRENQMKTSLMLKIRISLLVVSSILIFTGLWRNFGLILLIIVSCLSIVEGIKRWNKDK
jgi:hypothetical protein